MSFCTARVAPEKAVFRPALPLHSQPGSPENVMKHGAIETAYKGYLFRSRLEARWAVFMDTLGIEWKYETQGYEIDGQRYLPDFYLPESKDWVEVKGDPKAIANDHARMSLILGPQSPLPGFAAGDSCLLLLGEIPDHPSGCVLHPALVRHEGKKLQRVWSLFYKDSGGDFGFGSMRNHMLFGLFQIPVLSDLEANRDSPGWLPTHVELPTPGNWPEVREAYAAARRARFEHGAHGT